MNQKTLNHKKTIENLLSKSEVEFESDITIDPEQKGYLVHIRTEHDVGIFSDSDQKETVYYIFNDILIELLKEVGQYEKMTQEEKDELPTWLPVSFDEFVNSLKGEKALKHE